MIHVNGGSSNFYLGDDGSGKYVDNISFCTKVVTNRIAHGGHIIGGHYYQTESALAFVDAGTKLNQVKNAKFYLAPGSTALFAVDSTFAGQNLALGNIGSGKATVTNCEFYATESVPVLYSTGAPAMKFSDCKFYGVAPSIIGTGSIAQNANAVEGEAVEYRTVTFPNGAKEFYVANSLEEAKAYVENHPYYLVGNAAPYFVEDGGKYYYVEAPNITLEYDSSFNAIFTENCARKQVYYTVEKNGAILQFNTDAANHFHNDVYVGVGNNFGNVCRNLFRGNTQSGNAVFVELQNALHV